MLKDIQQTFASDVINNEAKGNYLAQNGFTGADLIHIYRNNYLFTLTDALKASYSCVLRLVGEEFFEALARQYVFKYLPTEGSLQNYGDQFAHFIEHFEPCNTLPYLVDIAKFERAYEMCYHSIDGYYLLSSIYPVSKIWQLDESSDLLNLDVGDEHILIQKIDDKVVVETLSPDKFKQLEKQNDQNIRII